MALSKVCFAMLSRSSPGFSVEKWRGSAMLALADKRLSADGPSINPFYLNEHMVNVTYITH